MALFPNGGGDRQRIYVHRVRASLISARKLGRLAPVRNDSTSALGRRLSTISWLTRATERPFAPAMAERPETSPVRSWRAHPRTLANVC